MPRQYAPAKHRRPHPVDMALKMLGMATTFTTWTQNMTCIRWRIGQGGFTVGYPNAMALAMGPIVYVVVYLLGFVLLGQMCEYAFFQNHFGNCLAGKASTPNLDVHSGALASCSEVFGHHDTYGGISSTFGDNQIGWAVLERLELGMDNTREQLKKLQHLTGRLFEGARYGLSTIQEDKEKRTSGDYVYAQKGHNHGTKTRKDTAPEASVRTFQYQKELLIFPLIRAVGDVAGGKLVWENIDSLASNARAPFNLKFE
ncbi:hypothetical protein PG995_003011 [Apiospora arundinis]